MKSKLLLLALVSAVIFACKPKEKNEATASPVNDSTTKTEIAENSKVAATPVVDEYEFELGKKQINDLLAMIKGANDHCIIHVIKSGDSFEAKMHAVRDSKTESMAEDRSELGVETAVTGPCKCRPCCPPDSTRTINPPDTENKIK